MSPLIFFPPVLLLVTALDLALLAPLPALLLWRGRPGLATFAALLTAAGVVADHEVNFAWISWPGRFPLNLLALPGETVPISFVVASAIGVVALRRWARSW